MQGFKPGFKPADKQKGGKIKGPGTGTSDSIKAEIPKGSYIMPADSTQQVGPKALDDLGEPVPVNVSNGEYQMPPEQVHAVGVQALNQMRDATHMPAPAGFKPQNDGLYFSGGGSPAEEERKRLAGAGPSPQMGAVALGNERRAERMSGEGMYGKANADVGGALNYLNRGDPVKDAASAVGGFFARSSDQARLADYGNTGAPSPIEATPAAAPTPPAAVGATEPPATKGRTSYGFTPDPEQGPAPGMSVRPTSAEGIKRIDGAPGLNSPLFTNLPAGQAVSGVQVGASTGGQPQAAGFAAQGGGAAARDQQASAMIAENNRIRQNRRDGRADNWTPNSAESRRDADQRSALQNRNMAIERAQRAQFFGRTGERDMEMQNAAMYEADRTGGQKLESDERAAAMREEGESRRSAERNATDRERVGVDRRRADSEAEVRGFEARGMERAEKLYAAYESAKTPEERAAAAEQLRALSGKEAPNRFTVVPGGQEVTEQGMLRTVPSIVLNNQTGQPVDLGRAAARPSPPENHIAALKKNPAQAAQFDAFYGPGAAANYLGAN